MNTKIATNLVAAPVALLLVLGGCNQGDSESARDQCTTMATNPVEAQADLDSASPGNTLCFSGVTLAATDLVLTKPGRERAPIKLVGDETTVRSVRVSADHVVVEGFTTNAGEGLVLAGSEIIARENTVRDAVQDGISCETCSDSLIERNVVERADGSGIIIEGNRISVMHNRVNGSIMRMANDADGIRFFGAGHRISNNTIRNIKDDGYADPPHTDCFQTYDNSRPPTTDAVISNNHCSNVDHQCLIATAEQAQRSSRVHFTGNTCAVEGSQAVLLQWFPGVEVRDNDVYGPNLYRGVSLQHGSVNGAIFGNRFRGGFPYFDVDDSSKPGLRHGYNTAR